MTLRILFLREGTSDEGIAPHILTIAVKAGFDISITDPPLDEQDKRIGSSVQTKLRAAVKLGGSYHLIVVHRDADRAGVEARVTEISDAVNVETGGSPFVPVVPVRMTEAWLLTSEQEIRRVAGKPNGKAPLDLPSLKMIEKIPDPKKVLREAIATASEETGRRLKVLNQRFSQNRRRLLERLDPDGPVAGLPSWQHFVTGIENGLKTARDGPG
jgi:Domain of unknown function (DUF4276)